LSHELEALFGLSGSPDWSLDAFLCLIHPDDRAAFQAELSAAIEARRRLACDFRVRPEGGDWRWFEVRGEAVYGAVGEALRFYGICMDVTARKREQQLLAHLAAVVESADDAIVSKTLDGVITSWNTGARRLFGFSAGEIVGRPITVLIPEDMQGEEATIIAKIRSGERIDHFVTTRVAKDGTRKRVSISVSPVRDASGRIVGASKIAREIAT
jgi:PAS domain S-box-containing protein